VLAAAAGLTWWQQRDVAHFLERDPAPFAQRFAAPTDAGSAATRAELDELLRLQVTRTAEQVARARADRKKRIAQFHGALGLDPASPPELPALERLAERVEDDVRIHVRAAKERFRRLRPYEIEPRLEPCIEGVHGDLSYPSGHAAFGYSMRLSATPWRCCWRGWSRNAPDNCRPEPRNSRVSAWFAVCISAAT
jgi:acid phosphatase (class A)